jgi:hypothetical protein
MPYLFNKYGKIYAGKLKIFIRDNSFFTNDQRLTCLCRLLFGCLFFRMPSHMHGTFPHRLPSEMRRLLSLSGAASGSTVKLATRGKKSLQFHELYGIAAQ